MDEFEVATAYNNRELAALARAIRNMGDQAEQEAQDIGFELAQFAVNKIQAAASFKGIPAKRIADGGKAYQSSKIGEMAFGFASQKFSGGGTTQLNYKSGGKGILAGWEFGSNRHKQFPGSTGTTGRFIYPTLKAIQPSIVDKWEQSLDRIMKEWTYDGGL